jgi:hypothetical protein
MPDKLYQRFIDDFNHKIHAKTINEWSNALAGHNQKSFDVDHPGTLFKPLQTFDDNPGTRLLLQHTQEYKNVYDRCIYMYYMETSSMISQTQHKHRWVVSSHRCNVRSV